MSTEMQHAPTAPRRTPGSRAVLTAGIPIAVLAWLMGTGSVGGGTGGITGDGRWTDAEGQITTIAPETYQIVLSPSPLVLMLSLLLLSVAWWTRGGTGIPAWLSPAAAASGIIVPIAALVGTWLWVRGFDHPWVLGDAVQGPWWALTRVTIGRDG